MMGVSVRLVGAHHYAHKTLPHAYARPQGRLLCCVALSRSLYQLAIWAFTFRILGYSAYFVEISIFW